jgi:hypothetical protein
MFSGLTIERATYPALYAASKQAFLPILEVIKQGQSRGQIGQGDVEQISLVFWSLIHGLTMLIIEDQIPNIQGQPAIIELLLNQAIEILYRGLEPK